MEIKDTFKKDELYKASLTAFVGASNVQDQNIFYLAIFFIWSVIFRGGECVNWGTPTVILILSFLLIINIMIITVLNKRYLLKILAGNGGETTALAIADTIKFIIFAFVVFFEIKFLLH